MTVAVTILPVKKVLPDVSATGDYTCNINVVCVDVNRRAGLTGAALIGSPQPSRRIWARVKLLTNGFLSVRFGGI